jgi:hypothetical protein
MSLYKLCPNDTVLGTPATCVQRLSDTAFIPFDPANTDAVEFCKWLKDGNVPEASDDGEVPTQEEIDAIIAKLS